MIEISGEHLSASVNPFGAELSSLRDADGRELMTDADPAFWSGRAPLLFPIVGALEGGVYRLDGIDYALPQHGFARRREFEVVEQAPDRARFRLVDDEEALAVYPFAFALDAEFTLEGSRLTTAITIANTGDKPMPASFGFHPAFAWPLPYGSGRADHAIMFAADEPERLAVLDGALTAATDRPSPLDGRILRLDDALFENGALIWRQLASRSLRYGAGAGPVLEMEFDAPMLGIWTRPGARFVCVEPWWGIADPKGFDGEIWDKPGIMRFEPGQSRTFAMRVTLRC